MYVYVMYVKVKFLFSLFRFGERARYIGCPIMHHILPVATLLVQTAIPVTLGTYNADVLR